MPTQNMTGRWWGGEFSLPFFCFGNCVCIVKKKRKKKKRKRTVQVLGLMRVRDEMRRVMYPYIKSLTELTRILILILEDIVISLRSRLGGDYGVRRYIHTHIHRIYDSVGGDVCIQGHIGTNSIHLKIIFFIHSGIWKVKVFIRVSFFLIKRFSPV